MVAAPRMRSSPLAPIFVTVFVDVLGLTLMLPLLPFYALHFGATTTVAGILLGTYSLCQLFSGPILGRISDRVGRKPTLLASQAGTFAGFLIIASAGSLWMLFLGRIIDGLTAGNLAIAQAYITDVTAPEKRTKAFALIGVAFGMGFLLGPAISGVLADHYGFAAPAYAAAGLSLLSIVMTATLLPNVKPAAVGPSRRASVSLLLGRPAPRRVLAEFLFFTLSFAMLTGGLPFFLHERFAFGAKETGYVYAYSGLIGAFVQGGAIGRVVKALGEEKLSLYGFFGMVVGYGLLGFATELWMLLVLVAIGSLGISVVRPSLTTLLTKSVERTEHGAALGVSQSVASLSQMTGPPLATLLIAHGALLPYGLVMGALALFGAWLVRSTAPAPAA